MTAFHDHRRAAMALLTTCDLRPKEGQFCGGLAFDSATLTVKQRAWLDGLLDRHGLPPLARAEQG